MHAQGGSRGEEQPEGQGNREPPALPATPPLPQSSSLLEQLKQVWESVKHTNKRLEWAETARWERQALGPNTVTAATDPEAAERDWSAATTGSAVGMGNAATVGGTATVGDTAAMGDTISEGIAAAGAVAAATNYHTTSRR